MVTLLEFIFQGFFEWVYSLILEIWNYFSSSLLTVMSLDFAYLKTHIPIMGDIQQILLAVGWALLLGNLVFQALRSMAFGLGFEGEDPKLLFARTFIFGFLLLSSPQICETVLGVTSSVIALLEVPDAINIQLIDGSAIGIFTASWLLVIIFDLITMFMVLSLLLEVAERYIVLAILTITAPLAFAMGGSKSTSEIFSGWCRMFGSMCLLMTTNIVFFKMLLSVVSTVPSFPDVFLWMVLVISIVKVAKKADEIITRIGLNPAITGNKSTLPGVIAYTVFRTALSMVTKGAAGGISSTLGLAGKTTAGVGKRAGMGKDPAGRTFKGTGKGFGTAADVGGAAAHTAGGRRYGGDHTKTGQAGGQQEHSQTNQQNTSQTQTCSQRQETTQETGGYTMGFGSTFPTEQASRKTSVQSGTRRGASYVTPPGSQSKIEQTSTSHRDSARDSITPSTGFTGFHRPKSDGFGGPGTKMDTRRSGSAFGGQPGVPQKEASFSGVSSKVSQKTEVIQSGTAGTERPSTFGKPAAGTQHSRNSPPTTATLISGAQGSSPAQQEPRQVSQKEKAPVKGNNSVPQPSTAGTRSTQRPSIAESRHSRNAPLSPAAPPSGAQNPNPVQQKSHQVSGKDKTLMKDSGSVPGVAGTRSTQRSPVVESQHSRNAPLSPAAPPSGAQNPNPVQQKSHQVSGKDKTLMKDSGSVPGVAGTRSTQRPPTSEPRHSRNGPTVPVTSTSGVQGYSQARQEPSRASGKDTHSVKSGGSSPHPGTAGTVSGLCTPPGQKLGGESTSQKPMRQTKRKGDPTSE